MALDRDSEPGRGRGRAKVERPRRSTPSRGSAGRPAFFITGRFRSGSTLLWNLYRQVEDVAAYYEPLHDRLLDWIEHPIEPQPTHFHVESYFDEYPPREELAPYHRRWFAGSDLFLEAGDEAPELEAYIRFLIEAAGSRQPVLQFNRVDFRLGWLKEHFPGTPILHLYRDPRHEWRSAIKGYRGPLDLEADPYYMTTWARDLSRQFPFLASDQIRHLYQRHYYLWRLSYLMGERQADRTLRYEDLIADPKRQVREILAMAKIPAGNLERCLRVVEKPTSKGGSREENALFAELEAECDQLLDRLGISQGLGLVPWKQLVAANAELGELVAAGEQRWAVRSGLMAAASMVSLVDEKERVIQELVAGQAGGQEQADELDRLAGELSRLEAEAAETAEVEAEAERQLAALRMLVDEKERVIQGQVGDLAESQAQARGKDQQLAELDQELRTLQSAAARSGAELTELVEHKEQVIQGQLAELAGVREQTRQIEEKERVIQGQVVDLAEAQERARNLEAELARVQAGRTAELEEKERVIQRQVVDLGEAQERARGIEAELARSHSERAAELQEKESVIQGQVAELAELREQTGQIEDKERVIQGLVADLAEARKQASQVEEKEKVIQGLVGDLAEARKQASQVEEKERVIQGLVADLAEVRKQASQVEEKERVIQGLVADLAEARKQASQVEEKEKVIQGLVADLSEAQARGLQVEEKEQVIQGQLAELAEAREKFGQVEEKERVIQGLVAELAEVREQMHLIEEKERVIQGLVADLAEARRQALQVEEKEKVIQGLVADLSEAQARGLQVEEKEQIIQGQLAELAAARERATEVEEKESVIQRQVADIAGAQEQLQSKEGELARAQAERAHELEEKEQVIQRHVADLAASQELARSKEEELTQVQAERAAGLEEKELVIQRYVSELAESQSQSREKEQELARLEAEVAGLEGDPARLAAELERLRTETTLLLHAKETVINDQHRDIAAVHQMLSDKQRDLMDTHRRLKIALDGRWFASLLLGLPSDASGAPLPRPRSPIRAAASAARGRLRPSLWHLDQYPPRPLNGVQVRPLGRRVGALPKISIVTPSFNHGTYLETTMRSVLDQEYPNLEYVVQDGGSKDETVAILKRYADRLKAVESAPDGGQADAINKGFAKTTGEIMAYLNSDDLLLPGALQYVGEFMASHPAVDVVYGHRFVIDQDGHEIGRWVLPPHDPEALKWADYIPQETMFWRRSLFEKVGAALDTSFWLCLDWDLILRFQDAGARFVRAPRFLGAFRYHTDSHTFTDRDKRGLTEMSRLREAQIGRPVTQEEVDVETVAYLRRHVVYREMHKLGLVRY